MKFSPKYLAAALLALTACSQPAEQERNYLQELQSVDKLVLAQMSISKMASIDDIDLDNAVGMKQTAAALIDKLKIGSRKAAYSYDTYLRAYIDMSQLGPDDLVVDRDARTISLTLPPVQTEYEGRDITIREDHYRVTGLRSEVDQNERAQLKELINTALKAEVEANPEFRRRLEVEARDKARAYFGSIAAEEGYAIDIRFKPGKGGA